MCVRLVPSSCVHTAISGIKTPTNIDDIHFFSVINTILNLIKTLRYNLPKTCSRKQENAYFLV